MYRNRARAAHVLQPSAPVAVSQSSQPPVTSQPGGYTGDTGGGGHPGGYGYQAGVGAAQPGGGHNGEAGGGGQVQFFNPAAYQNGFTQPPVGKDLSTGPEPTQNEVQNYPVKDVNSWDKGHETWGANAAQTTTTTATNNNNVELTQQEYVNSNYESAGQTEQNPEAYAEPILDPSGQWYWDYNQQQWFPYYPNITTENREEQQQQQMVGEISAGMNSMQLQEHAVQQLEQAHGDPHVGDQQQVLDNYHHEQQHSDPYLGDINSAVASGPEVQSAVAEDTKRYRQDSEMSHASQMSGYPPALSAMPPAVAAPPVSVVEQRNDSPVYPAQEPVAEAGPSMGPPDLVDHRPNTSQPEIVSDLAHPLPAVDVDASLQTHAVPPPDMFALLPGSGGAVHPPRGSLPGQISPDLGAPPSQRHAPDLGAAPPEVHPPALVPGAPPTRGASSLPPPPASSMNDPDLGATSAPDLTAQSVIQNLGSHSVSESCELPESVSHDQHYDFYKGQIESAMPDLTSGRSGVLPPVRSSQPANDGGKAPDILRTEPLVPTSDRNLFMETGELREEDANRVSYQVSSANIPPPPMSPSGLPPMVGGNDPPSSLVRMVVGESLAQAPPPPMMTSAQRLVEGESTQPTNILPPLPAREIEGEALQDPPPFSNPRTIEGDDGGHVALLSPPPVRTREVEGQQQQVSGAIARMIAGGGPPPLSQPDDVSSVPSTPATSSPTHLTSQTEVRSEAAGSERRDQTVMGGPPALKAPPLPTPGRDVAGQESTAPPYGARRRGDDHKKSTYDSDEERNQDSESERERERRRLHPRRPVSPGARSTRSKPSTRGYDRLNRSSTEREEEERKRRDYYRDRRDDDRYYRKDYPRGDRDRYRDYRRYRDDDEESYREDDRRSMHGGSRRIKDEPRHYRDDPYYRRNRMDSDYERESHYGDDIMNRSRPGSRAGSVSHYDPNESLYGRGMSGNMAFFQQQLLQQQLAMMNPLQYQVQTAVREMEKVLENPENVNIYRQHWETYERQPQLMEKLRLENPVMHHLLHHFRRNFWHLVEDKKPVIKEEKKDELEADREVEQFARNFHQLSPTHRPESRQAGQESTILGYAEDSALRDSSSVLPERLTPVLFSRPHVCARISASGMLVKVEATAPQEGQTASVELHSMSGLLAHTREHHQLAVFPGPLKPKETHKNDVIKFCERKIAEGRERRMMDRESYELLWNMMILLLRQKGQVEGSDLADLLLREQPRLETSMDHPHDRSRASSHRPEADFYERNSRASSQRRAILDPEESSVSSYSEDQTDRTISRSIINSGVSQEDSVAKFRSYLLHGNKQEGLEYAMKVGLWGHALFLASKMDQRTYAGVMTRFANGLAINDPLQTLYQLMSARIPSAMKHCADQRWGDWRPHLAMILSNPFPESDINRRSMVTLGDTLMGKGQLYAAQFCYIVSAVEFGTYSKKSSKLVLLGSSVGDKSVEAFATNEAIQCTEIYEFVQKLGNQDFEMPTLQPFKFLHAVRLCEAGLAGRAQDYCREIAHFVMRNPSRVETDFLPDFLQQLSYLADRLKYQDPQYTTSSGELSEIPDPEWMTRFAETVQNITYSVLPETTDYESMSYMNPEQMSYAQDHQMSSTQVAPEQNGYAGTQHQYHDYYPEYPAHQQQEAVQTDYAGGDSVAEPAIPEAAEVAPSATVADSVVPEPSQTAGGESPSTDSAAMPTFPPMFNPGGFSNSGGGGFQPPPMEPLSDEMSSRKNSVIENRSRQGSVNEPVDPGYYAQIQSKSPPPSAAAAAGVPPPSSMPPAMTSSEQNNNIPPPGENKKPKTATADEDKKSAESKGKKSSWFGGIFGKLLKAPNQVHLPDDSDKRIVYDDKLGRWVNLDGEDDSLAPAAPPPMDPAFMGGNAAAKAVMNGGPAAGNAAPNGSAPPAASQSFRAPKRRGRGYVDVFGQSGATKPITSPPMMMPSPGEPSSLPPIPAIFNPSLAPIADEGSSNPSDQQQQPMSLPGTGAETMDKPPSMPMMFNPSSMASVTDPPAF